MSPDWLLICGKICIDLRGTHIAQLMGNLNTSAAPMTLVSWESDCCEGWLKGNSGGFIFAKGRYGLCTLRISVPWNSAVRGRCKSCASGVPIAARNAGGLKPAPLPSWGRGTHQRSLRYASAIATILESRGTKQIAATNTTKVVRHAKPVRGKWYPTAGPQDALSRRTVEILKDALAKESDAEKKGQMRTMLVEEIAKHVAELIAFHDLQFPKLEHFSTDFAKKGGEAVERVIFKIDEALSCQSLSEGRSRLRSRGPLPCRVLPRPPAASRSPPVNLSEHGAVHE